MKIALIVIAVIICAFIVLFIISRNRLSKLRDIPDSHDLQDKIDELGELFVTSEKGIGMVIGIVKEGRAYVNGFGSTELNNQIKPTRETIFELSSAGKIFTTSALQIMNDRDELPLETKIKDVLSPDINLSVEAYNTTLLNLATHTSGFPFLPKDLDKKIKDTNLPYKDINREDIDLYLSNCNEKTPEGDFRYSDFGMGLLGHILEYHTQDSFENIIKKEICEKLDMKNTTMTLDKEQKRLLAKGYTLEKKEAPLWQDNALTGCRSFLSNAEDMIKFIHANLEADSTPISSSLRNTLQKYFNDASALGWQVAKDYELLLDLKPILWSTGKTCGHSCYLAINDTNKTGVIIFANTATTEIKNIGVRAMHYASKISFDV